MWNAVVCGIRAVNRHRGSNIADRNATGIAAESVDCTYEVPVRSKRCARRFREYALACHHVRQGYPSGHHAHTNLFVFRFWNVFLHDLHSLRPLSSSSGFAKM
jgi:hypothetical protein